GLLFFVDDTAPTWIHTLSLHDALPILGNAVKYSPRGGNIAVMVFPDREGNAKVSVHDEGIGIRHEDIPKLFQKFTRLFDKRAMRSEEHTSELQSRGHLVCRLLLEKKKK